MSHCRRRAVRALVPAILAVALAGCGGPKERLQNRPEDVARAAFAALKAGEIEPLLPVLMTAAEAQSITKLDAEEFEASERERWRSLLARYHERIDIDWASATIRSLDASLDAMGQGALVRLKIGSDRGTAEAEVAVSKVGRRFVFAGLKPLGIPPPRTDDRQAAPDDSGR